MILETERLKIHPAAREEMERFIALQEDEMLKAAYSEMLEGCIRHPKQWEWYATWMIELKNDTHVGELCFMGLNEGSAEIGYGIAEEHQGKGYATEAVNAAVQWALGQQNVSRIEAEAEEDNTASLRVLEKCGFVPTGVRGEEGPRFVCRKKAD